MTQELHYTSAPRGLRPGSVGFCTVAQTPNLPGPLVERLESLSGYQQVFPPHDPSASLNPVAYSHLRITVGGRLHSVLSRVGFAGLDYSARSNKYAHHIVLDSGERPAGGPAWLLAQPGFMQTSWQGEPRTLPAGRAVPSGDRPPGIALAWARQTGDPGWAGVLAESFLADPRKPSYLLFEPGMDLLPLFVEALALIPPERRWDVELSTYFTQLLQGTSCPWRGVLADSAEAKNAHRMPGALVIDLRRPPGEARGGDLVQLARTGRLPARKADVAPSTADSPGPVSSSRAIRAQPPAKGEVGYSLTTPPPKVPRPRSIRELEGFEGERSSLPWGKISAGLAAMLLIALGAGYWSGMFPGMRSPVHVDDLITSVNRDTSKKVEKDQAKQKQDETKPDAIANEEEKKDGQLVEAQEKPQIQQTKDAAKPPAQAGPPLVADVPKPKPDNQPQPEKSSKEETGPLPKPVDLPRGEPLVWFRELPAIANSLLQDEKRTEVATIDFSERILPPIEVLQKKIATNQESRKEAKAEDNSELDQMINTEHNQLIIQIPSKSLVADPEKIATISIDEKKLTFHWNGIGARRGQGADDVRDAVGAARRQLADLVRDAAIKFDLKGKGTRYVLLRDPKPRTERVSLKADATTESARIRPINISWAEDAKNLADCEWELVVTDWRIVSALAGKELVTFASMKPNEPNKDVKLTILNEGLSFHLMFTKDTLTARFRAEKDLGTKMAVLDTRYGKLGEKIAELQKDVPAKQNDGNQESPQDKIKKLDKDQADIKKKLSLYNHYLKAEQVFLDVGIGLKLSNGKVIEIARLGPRWKNN